MRQKNNSFLRDLSIQDGRGNILAIQIRNFGLDVDRSFDCVTLSARYDHGFSLQDIAEAVLYLASDAARFVTGTHIKVDGGITIGPRHSWDPHTTSPISQALGVSREQIEAMRKSADF